MNAFEFENKMIVVVRNERKSTREVLEMINQVFDRKHHLEQGYSSLFDYLVKGHGYSESSAQRRIQAAKLLRSNPEVSLKLEEGSLNLTTLSKAQGMLQAQEKLTGEKVKLEQKEETLQAIENKSTDQTEKVLFELFPDLSKEDHTQKLTRISPNQSRFTTHLDEETLCNLERAKELLSHILPNGNFTDVMKYIVKDFLNRKDPLRKKTKASKGTKSTAPKFTNPLKPTDSAKPTAAAAKPCVKIRVKRSTIQKAKGQCEYRNPITRKICGSTYQLQIDHVKPKAIGGTDEPQNLRCLCRAHNLLMAERNLGREFMDRNFLPIAAKT